MSKQICILTIEVSAKLTHLRFLHKVYSPAACGHVFLMHHDSLNWIFIEGHQGNILVILKSVQWFLTRRFLNCFIQIIRENKLRTLAAMFLTNHESLNKPGRGSPKEHSCQVILKSVQWFLTRRFLFFFLYRYIVKISPAPLQSWFLSNHDCLNNLGRGSPKEQSYQVILKSIKWFLTRIFFKFSIYNIDI